MPSINGLIEKVARKTVQTKFGDREKFGFLINGQWYSALGSPEYWSQYRMGGEFPEHEWVQSGDFKNLVNPLKAKSSSKPSSNLAPQPSNLEEKLKEIILNQQRILREIEKLSGQVQVGIEGQKLIATAQGVEGIKFEELPGEDIPF